MSAGIKTNNWLTNWMIDRVNNSATLNPETGQYDAGFFTGGLGSALGLDVDLIEQTKKTNVQNTAANNLLDSSTYTRADLGFSENQKLTEAGVKSAVKAKNEEKAEKTKKKDRTYLAEVRQEGYDRQDASFRHTASEAAKDRALTRDLNLSSSDMKMQMKFMDMDLADKRMAYDRETRRMDKRDRAIASLMAGIGQLGGAFAL